MVSRNHHPGENEKVELIVLDGLEDAEIGVASSYDDRNAMIYSIRGIIRILMERDGMGCDEAVEYFYFKILTGYASTGNPMFIDDLGDQDDSDDSDGPDDPDNDPNPVKPINQVEHQESCYAT